MIESQSNLLSFFSLAQLPFDEIHDSHYYYESNGHVEALERLKYTIQDENTNMGLLIGEPGCGKTFTYTLLKNQLPKNKFEFCVIENSFYKFNDIVYEVLNRVENINGQRFFFDELNIPNRNDRYALMRSLKKVLTIIQGDEERHMVVILDEAQQLLQRDLDELKSLTNLIGENGFLITLFFVGQPGLLDNIKASKQVNQKISIRFCLENLDLEQTKNYVSHRLKVAGHSGSNIVTLEALEVLFRFSLGIPREINRICKLALEYAYTEGKSKIEAELMEIVVEDLGGDSL